MNSFWTQMDSAIVGFFNPLAADPAVRAPVRNDWPLQRLDYACYTALAYLIFVIGSMFLCKDKKKGDETKSDAKRESDKKKDDAKGEGDKKKADDKTQSASKGKKSVSIGEKIKKDGILVFGAMALYNATQVLLCAWMVYASLMEHRKRGMSLVCNPHKLSEDGMAFVLHIFYLSKVLDFADTFFMIVKGNWRQVSFLHVYHHTSIFLIYWLNAQAFYDADIYATIVLNGTIHFIMYGYYFATTFNVPVPMFIKKSITNSQLLQFVTMESQGAYILYNRCDSPRNIVIMYMVYISTMLVLFMNFKRQNYSSAKKAAGSKKAEDNNVSEKLKGA